MSILCSFPYSKLAMLTIDYGSICTPLLSSHPVVDIYFDSINIINLKICCHFPLNI